MRRSRRLFSTSVAALTLFAAAPVARADRAEDVASYQQEVARGSAAFDAGQYASARASFRAAYQIHPEPLLLFNVASTYRREGALARAIAAYRAFLDLAEPDDPRRILATQTVIDLEDQLALEQRRSTPAEALPVFEIDVRDEEARPAVAAVHHDPVPAGLYDRRHRARRPGAALRWTGLGLGATAVVTGGLAVAAGLEVGRAEDTLERLDHGTPWNHPQRDLYAQGQAAQQRMLLWSVATVALAATGVILYISGDRRDDRGRAATLTVIPSSDGASLSLSGPL